MDLQLLEHRLRVTSIDKPGLASYAYQLTKFIFLPHRSRCKFFSITESPEDYTVMLDEEGFKELPPSEHLHVAEHTWRALNVLANGFLSNDVPNVGVTKIANSVITPLAEHNVSVLMLSTYQTDYILVREDDLPVVYNTLCGELSIYREDNGELVPISIGESCKDVKKDISDAVRNQHTESYLLHGYQVRPQKCVTKALRHFLCSCYQHGTLEAFSQTVHPVLSPKNKFCILTVDPDTLPSISCILLDVMFYSSSSQHNSASLPDSEPISFFAFSLIDGYISIVMDEETKKRFPANLLLTSSSGELWRMVRIGGQPLGFDECGIVAQIAGPLAYSDISAYYISTFNFDHALVPEEDIEHVIKLLRRRQERQ